MRKKHFILISIFLLLAASALWISKYSAPAATAVIEGNFSPKDIQTIETMAWGEMRHIVFHEGLSKLGIKKLPALCKGYMGLSVYKISAGDSGLTTILIGGKSTNGGSYAFVLTNSAAGWQFVQ